MWYRYRPCVLTVKIACPGFVYKITVIQLSTTRLPSSGLNVTIKFDQTQSLTTIKWPNLGHETSATLPFHVWSSYSMSCFKQPTTNCAVEIRETSWAVALFSVVVRSLMTSQRRIFAVLEQFGVEGFCHRSEWWIYKIGQNSIPMLCRFYSAFTVVWFRSVLRSFVILIVSI